ncbi:MAG TPA: DUF6146 family protein, partial [Paludibacter sp.]
MKTLSILGLLMIVISACTSQKAIVKINSNQQALVNDSIVYELLVSDPQFETWFVTNYSSAKDHSESYYHDWNNQYVTDWNYHFMIGHLPDVFENYIDYDYNTDYGIELNRKLYYYFRYVETYLK